MGRPSCPACNVPMGKAGKVWSGTNKVQRYRCGKCGKTTIITTKDDKASEDSSANSDDDPPKKRLVILLTDKQKTQLKLRAINKHMTIEEYTEWHLFDTH